MVGGFDFPAGLIYWVTFASPAYIIKTQTTAGTTPITRVSSLEFTNTKQVYASAIAVDYIAKEAWVLFWSNPGQPGMIARVPTVDMVMINGQTFNSGFLYPSCVVADLSKGALYIGFNTIPGKV